jgi:hypothetical protein
MQNVFKEIDDTKKFYKARTGNDIDVDALAEEVDNEDDYDE